LKEDYIVVQIYGSPEDFMAGSLTIIVLTMLVMNCRSGMIWVIIQLAICVTIIIVDHYIMSESPEITLGLIVWLLVLVFVEVKSVVFIENLHLLFFNIKAIEVNDLFPQENHLYQPLPFIFGASMCIHYFQKLISQFVLNQILNILSF
jgi:hypothetical protein